MNIISKIMPSLSGEIESPEALEHRYRQFSSSLTGILLALVLIPMFIISLLAHSQYKRMLEEEEVGRLLLNAEQAENTVELFVVKLRSIINFAGHEDRYDELLRPGVLQSLFLRLRNSFPDYTDIEVIGPDGHTAAWEGDYVSKGQSYIGQPWYDETLNKGFYISNIFTGFRGVPHFVVAVSRDLKDGGQWVMRVNIDGKTLQRYVDAVAATAVDDLFLVDEKGILQTTPKKYGERGKPTIFPRGGALNHRLAAEVERHRQAVGGEYLIDRQMVDGKAMLRVARPVVGTPWRLVMVKEDYRHGTKWINFRNHLFFYLACCGILAILIIISISRAITAYIRESDLKRKQFLREAENNDKLASIGRLAAGVAHEINNPLAIINQKAGLMEDYMEMTGDFEYKKELGGALSGIDESVERCKTITHRLLGFARHTDVTEEQIEINKMLEEVTSFVDREASYNQVEINFHFAEHLTPIVSDRGQLQQVFLNILNNAIYAIGKDGEINISTRQMDPDHVQIEIADTGCGMNKETLDRLFEPFYTTKPTGKGTGLGMSITYGIINKLGGRIKVDSKEGKGTVFTFLLPVRHKEEGKEKTDV
jgi:two-component system NtrC family sensor kinase